MTEPIDTAKQAEGLGTLHCNGCGISLSTKEEMEDKNCANCQADADNEHGDKASGYQEKAIDLMIEAFEAFLHYCKEMDDPRPTPQAIIEEFMDGTKEDWLDSGQALIEGMINRIW